MSGSKVISVDAAAWRDAQASARELATVRRDMPRLVRQVERAARADVERARREAAARQDGTDRALAGLSEQAAKLERETGRRLREQGGRLAGQVAREREERRAELARMDARVGELRSESDAAAAAARRLFEDAATMRAAIRDTLPHERFAPGRLERLAARLDVAQRNLDAHAAGYSLSQIQDLYLDLSELRADVERLALEWEAVRAAALKALRTVAATIDDNAERRVEDAVMDVDHWTDGRLAELREEVRRQVALVEDPGCPLDAAALEALAAESAPGFEGRLDALVAEAADRIVASQLRVNVAEQVVEVLEGQGFAWADNTYASGDERREFFSRLRHRADGGEVVVEVAPDGEGAGFSLRIMSYEDDPDEAARRERSAAVSRALRAEGLHVGEPEEGGEPDPGLRDFAALSRPVAKRVRGGR